MNDAYRKMDEEIKIYNKKLDEMEREFTTLYDSFGTPIYEGDIVEYFDETYAHGEYYCINDECAFKIANLPKGFIEQAKKDGYTCEERWHNVESGNMILMCKPKVGIVKWNQRLVTYEPVISSQDGYNCNCFHFVVMENGGSGSYCKIIGNIHDNPELISLCANKDVKI